MDPWFAIQVRARRKKCSLAFETLTLSTETFNQAGGSQLNERLEREQSALRDMPKVAR